MASPRVLKAVSVALSALAELDPQEQQVALETIQNALRASREPPRDTLRGDPDR